MGDVRYDDGTLIAVHQKYPTNTAKQFTPLSEDSLKAMLQEGAEKKETLKQLLNRKLGTASPSSSLLLSVVRRPNLVHWRFCCVLTTVSLSKHPRTLLTMHVCA
jgi:hypothetical protein